jgi:hypothetical protein
MPGTSSSVALLQSEQASTEDFHPLQSDDYQEKDNREQKDSFRIYSHTPILAHFALVLLYTTIFISAVITLHHQNPKYSALIEALQSSPLLPALHYGIRTVNHNFEDTNPFHGAPLSAIESQWMVTLNGAHELRLTPTQMSTFNLTSVQLANGSNDYMVQPVAYNMLHCLYTIYKYAHPDFYGPDPFGPEWVKNHTDHCVDNLRQYVMCHGSTGFSTFRWEQARKIPWPVLDSREVCVNWTRFDGWVGGHSVDEEEVASQKSKSGGPLLVNPKMGPVTTGDYEDADKKFRMLHMHGSG